MFNWLITHCTLLIENCLIKLGFLSLLKKAMKENIILIKTYNFAVKTIKNFK